MRRVAVVLSALAFVGAALGGCGQDERATISIDHPDSLSDRPVHVRIGGLPAGHTVSVQLRLVNKRTLASTAAYRVPSGGVVDLRTAKPVGGTPYHGADPMGLFWTLRAKTDAPWHLTWTLRYTLTVRDGGTVVGRRTLTRRSTVSGLHSRKLRPDTDGVYGTMFEPPAGSPKRPGVLVFGGSEGGEFLDGVARMLAVHGFPSLSLAYFGEPGLPSSLTRVPLEYFAKAMTVLSHQPGVDPRHLAVLGGSRGGEAALLVGSYFPAQVHAVIALTPANVAVGAPPSGHDPAWTYRGKAIPYTRQFNEPAPTDVPKAVIPVERIAGPVLLTCGGRDAVWASCPYARAADARLSAHHDRYPHRVLAYPGAGHRSNALLPYVPVRNDPTAQADEAAKRSEWPATLAFLKQLRSA
ncbi:acyl-CoA thioesterase/bile acid-CoA:amino acid N-acyltransferase family protein [Actinocatenispora sera]|uniref:acyl-CoA thioesterase/bile acid-CoA:amino acid N-acyltransferase family protein n=1 Tax=Actinocatenispora sera TaxID=390989 RepID=UPI0012ECD444|nr:acyl-CoA thioesterase/bile acid-CoA:amino acid N-acyltransferase family protein [Actinocatenispora sera]